MTSFEVWSARTTSTSRITLAGEKKCMPDHRLGSLRHRRDLVDVQRAGVGGQHGAGLADGVELGEHVLLDVHALEHGLDDEIDGGQVVERQRPGDETHATVDVLHREAAVAGAALVVGPHDAEAPVEGLLLRLDDGDGDAGVDEVHGDAAAHGAGADDADRRDRDGRRVGRDVGDLPDLALGEEHVALGGRLRARDEAGEQLAARPPGPRRTAGSPPPRRSG